MIKTINIAGDFGDIGYAHGQALQSRIHKTIEFYLRLFDLPETRLIKLTGQYQRLIAKVADYYCDEIEAIAEGAGIDPWYIYALNALSEIFNLKPSECTTLYFKNSCVMGQNWDWAEIFEPLITIINIEYADGHKVTTLTEPGMLAKIGMNSAGVGVCLNILQSEITTMGLPVHLCLRMALDSRDFHTAENKLLDHAQGKASHILLADDQENCIGLEYKDNNLFKLRPDNGCLIHTNHYLAEDDPDSTMPATRERLEQAQSMALQFDDINVTQLMSILLDNSCGEDSIFCQGSDFVAIGIFNIDNRNQWFKDFDHIETVVIDV